MIQRERHVLGIDLIRFVAAAMVMGFHYDHAFADFRLPYATAGWVGVEVFFVISGYVIAFSAEGSSAADFAKARVARLMPGAWICGTITAAAVLIWGDTAGLLNQYARTMTLWLTGPFVDDVYWTLPIEIIFYVFVFCTLGRQSLLSLGALIRVLAISSGLWWFASAAIAFGAPNPLDAARFQAIPPILITLVQFGCYFGLGALFRECLRAGWTVGRVAVLITCICAGSAQIAFAAVKQSHALPNWPLNGAVVAPILAWVLLVLAIGASVVWNEGAWLLFGRWSGPIRVIGLSTYPLYLLHARFGSWLGHAANLGPIETALIIVALSVLVASVLEPPIRRGLRFAYSKAGRRLVATQPATQELV